jgi:cytochrome P450
MTFDPFDADTVHDAWPALRSLREEAAVVSVANGLRYVTRHAECKDTLRDTVAFSNASGFKAPGVVVPVEDRTLGELDPPQHSFVRRAMVTAITPKAVRAAEGFISSTASARLGAVPRDGGAVDLVPLYTVPLPNRVTVHLLGLPASDADMIAAWAKELMESGFPATNRSDRGEGFVNAFPEFAGYIDSQIARRLSGEVDADDVISRLARLEVDGSRLTLRQSRAMVRNLITGGLTTTSQLLGNLIHQVLTVPGLETAVRADPAVLDVAMEESLRLTPPVLLAPRGCVADVSIGGCPVHAGERVVVGLASANRDERVFDDPDDFRFDRPNAGDHLTFGYGPHVCPGASLARTVTRVGVLELLSAFPAGSLRLAPDYVRVNVPTFFESGPRTLDVVTAPAGRAARRRRR